LRLVVALAAAALAFGAGTVAERLAKEAEKAEKSGQVVQAYLLYARAAAAAPHNPLYWTKASALRIPATMISQSALPALGEKGAKKPSDPNVVGSLTIEQLIDLQRMTGPPHLSPVPGTRSFELRGDPKTLFEKVAADYGYTVIFEKDYNLTQPPVRFNISNIDYKGALHALETATNSFIVPLSEQAMLVAQDTTQKRQELEPNEAVGVPIPQRTSIQEAQELMVMVQQALEIRHVALDPVKRLIYMRDRASKVELARALYGELSGGKAQVSTEIEFISVGNTSSLNLGISLPSSFPLVNFGSVANSKPSVPAGFTRFLSFGGGKSFLGIGISDAGLFATASRSEASSLLRSTLVASDGQAATFHVGDKYPIQTGAYIGTGGLSAGGTTYATITTASYADLTATAVSNTGKMSLVVNSQSIPFTIPAGANSVVGLQNIINSLGAGVGAQVIQRGTKERPYTLLVVASTLGISSIQLYDDPDGAKIALLKKPEQASSITRGLYADATGAKVSATLTLNLAVGSTITPLALSDATNNLNGLRDAINSAGAGVTASVLNSGLSPDPYYLQVVASASNTGVIQVFDDPSGANTALLAATDEVNAASIAGKSVGGSAINLGQTYTPPPTFNFEDLGLVMKVTPYVHSLDEVTLEIEAEFKVLGTGSYNGVPVISTRKYQGKVRLRTSEYAIIAGLMSDSDARSISGIAGLAQLPGIGPLFGTRTRSNEKSKLLIVIKPSVTGMPPGEYATKTFWFGSEMKPLTVL
jgi:Flp pilus assembly secretin CpaC